MRIDQTQKGSLLLIIMAVSIIIAFIISFLYTVVTQARVGQLKRADIEVYHHFVYALRSQLEDPFTCHRMLGGILIPNVNGGVISNLNIPWTFQGSAGNLRAGWSVPGSRLVLQDVQMQRTGNEVEVRDPAPFPPIIPRPPSTFSVRDVRIVNGGTTNIYRTYPIRILVPPRDVILNLGLDPLAPISPPETIRPLKRKDLMIRLLANVDNAGRIFNCFGHESFAAACQTKGGAFNQFGPPDLKCQPDTNCFTGNPSLVSNPAVCNSQGTRHRYNAVQVGQLGVPMYICNLCREDL